MRIQPLYDLQNEVNRLFIAGSKFAKDDPRLAKAAASLDPLGAKVPVFRKLADDVRALAASEGREAADRLSSLGVLLYSILYTQGDHIEEGKEKKPQEPLLSLEDVDTSRSYAELARVRELALAKSGRLESAQEAHRDGVFADFRAFPYLDALLDDRYGELAAFAAGTVMPGAGRGVASFVLRSFRYEDTVPQARRFGVLVHYDVPELPAMVERIFGESLPGLQAEAIAFLARSAENEEMIIKLAGDRNKKVREAAYLGLAKLGTNQALDMLQEVFLTSKNAGNRQAATAALAEAAMGPEREGFVNEVLASVRQSFASLVDLHSPDKPGDIGIVGKLIQATKKLAQANLAPVSDAHIVKGLLESIPQFAGALAMLRNKRCSAVPAFLKEMLANKRFVGMWKRHVENASDGYMEEMCKRQFQHLLATVRDIVLSLDPDTAAEFHELVSPSLPEGMIKPF